MFYLKKLDEISMHKNYVTPVEDRIVKQAFLAVIGE